MNELSKFGIFLSYDWSLFFKGFVVFFIILSIMIFIYDRFGSLLAQLSPDTKGWNGIFNGRPLPESDYWFKAVTISNKEVKGHFSLKR